MKNEYLNIEDKFLQLAIIEQKTYAEIEKILNINRKEVQELWTKTKDKREPLAALRKTWIAKTKKEFNTIPKAMERFQGFQDWYEQAQKKCEYCEITQQEIDQLWKKEPQLTKRNRGRKLEIERKEPDKPYTNFDNLCFACYWCNNAKTDTFSHEEFKEIGQVIKNIWEKRLNQ